MRNQMQPSHLGWLIPVIAVGGTIAIGMIASEARDGVRRDYETLLARIASENPSCSATILDVIGALDEETDLANQADARARP